MDILKKYTHCDGNLLYIIVVSLNRKVSEQGCNKDFPKKYLKVNVIMRISKGC